MSRLRFPAAAWYQLHFGRVDERSAEDERLLLPGRAVRGGRWNSYFT